MLCCANFRLRTYPLRNISFLYLGKLLGCFYSRIWSLSICTVKYCLIRSEPWDHEIMLNFSLLHIIFLLMILVHVNLGFIWAKKNIFRTASFKSFLDKSKLVFLFLRANSFSPCCKASAFIFLEAFRCRPWQWYINLLRSVLDLLRCCCFFQLEYNSVTMCFTKQTKYHDWKEAHILVPLEKEKKKGKKKVKKDY